MSFVQFSRVCLAFGDRDILKNVTINLAAGTRAALSGANGSGKTTLMKVMAGLMEYESGERAVQKDCIVSYLPQSGIVHTGKTLKAEADSAFAKGYELFSQMEIIGEELASESNTPDNETKQAKLLERHHEIHEILEISGWYRREALAEQILTGLGFLKTDLNRNVEEFSGGWQMRIALAKVLLQKPDILLLDEPTNYLDIEARTWLEDFLLKFEGGFLIVSHDRYFLDVTINEVYELFNGELHKYVGNYTKYEKVRRVELESLIARYEIQQQEINKLEDFVRRFRYKASKAAQAQERLKQLEKMERIEIPESLKKIHFNFPPAPHSGRLVLSVEGLTKTYSVQNIEGEHLRSNTVLKELDLVVEKGDRLLVVGRNGAGKSTLLRILAEVDANFEGAVKQGSGVSIGYFSQDNAETMNGSMSILEMLEKDSPLELIPKLRDMLGAFLFRGDDVYKTIDVLSGGEKSRIALLRILLKPVNLLILDEPTNHLDLHSKDVLLEAIKQFGGTVIFVSHDRGFMSSLASRVLELTPAKSLHFPGGYEYYLEQTQVLQDLHQAEKNDIRIEVGKQKETVSLSYDEQKRIKSERRKQEKEEARLMAEIEKAESKKQELETELAKPEVYSIGEKSRLIQKEIESLDIEILNLTEQWEKHTEILE